MTVCVNSVFTLVNIGSTKIWKKLCPKSKSNFFPWIYMWALMKYRTWTVSSVHAIRRYFQLVVRFSLHFFSQPLKTKVKWVRQTWPGFGKACDESPPLLFLLSTLHQAGCCGNSSKLWLLFDHTMVVWPVTKWWQTWPTHRAASI